MYISKIHIENIRCFDNLTIDFVKNGEPVLWTTLLGDNSTGKTTLLKCIALGLCDESGAAGLLRESEEGYIRHTKRKGIIIISLSNPEGNELGKIITTIEKKGSNKYNFENLRQATIPKNFDPWGEIFICAYGIGRGISGTGDISGYSPISAVYNLFNYSEGLQNPELVIRRIGREKNKELKRILKTALSLSNNSKGDRSQISLRKDGIRIKGGPIPKQTSLRDIADGYKSTFQWISDFFGWAISYDQNSYRSKDIQGIVLVDALEEHLHPKWQRELVHSLHKDLFPNVQFVISSHSPLIASSTVDHDDSSLIELELIENSVRKNPIKKEEIKGLRADEVLRHDAFGLYATASIGSENAIARYIELKSKNDPTPEEIGELHSLNQTIKPRTTFGDTKFEAEVEEAVRKTLTEMITNPSDAHFLEIKNQLRDIFKSDK